MNSEEVNPATVGQFTGLHDSTQWDELTKDEQGAFLATTREDGTPTIKEDWNGREIYEGDILGAWDNEGGGITGEVSYRDNAFCILTTTYKGEELQNARWIYAENFEVIGNIHDNPELLKGWK